MLNTNRVYSSFLTGDLRLINSKKSSIEMTQFGSPKPQHINIDNMYIYKIKHMIRLHSPLICKYQDRRRDLMEYQPKRSVTMTKRRHYLVVVVVVVMMLTQNVFSLIIAVRFDAHHVCVWVMRFHTCTKPIQICIYSQISKHLTHTYLNTNTLKHTHTHL